mmetsp:Transcript_23152/g.41720  ORF Transcript_23152/g.41720 Transcript_23152/m.41720 type:complete len:354 (-) Transcript_23152:450-1511(-)
MGPNAKAQAKLTLPSAPSHFERIAALTMKTFSSVKPLSKVKQRKKVQNAYAVDEDGTNDTGTLPKPQKEEGPKRLRSKIDTGRQGRQNKTHRGYCHVDSETNRLSLPPMSIQDLMTAVPSGKSKSILAFEPLYKQLRAAWEENPRQSATQTDEGLSWPEVQQFANKIGWVIEHSDYRKMDRDKGCSVDFPEMLRYFFRALPQQQINVMIRKWGLPYTVVQKKVVLPTSPTKKKTWRDQFDPQAQVELELIFHSMHGHKTGGITIEELRKNTNPRYCPDELLEEVLHQADQDQDQQLSLEEFASVMEDAYLYHKHHRPKPVHLHFCLHKDTSSPWLKEDFAAKLNPEALYMIDY